MTDIRLGYAIVRPEMVCRISGDASPPVRSAGSSLLLELWLLAGTIVSGAALISFAIRYDLPIEPIIAGFISGFVATTIMMR